MPEHLRALAEDLDCRQQAFDAEWPKVMELRGRYFVERTEAARLETESAIEATQRARVDLDAAIASTFEAAGIDPDDLAEEKAPVGDPFPGSAGASIQNEAPAATAFVEDYLPEAIELIERHAPSGWMDREPAELFPVRLESGNAALGRVYLPDRRSGRRSRRPGALAGGSRLACRR
jgi:hypothetical protein